MQTTDTIRALFQKYISGSATSGEVEQLSAIADEYTNDELAEILEPLAMSFEKDPNFKIEEWEPAIRAILQHAPEKVKIIFTGWYRVAAAAVIVLMLTVGGYFYFNKKSEPVIAKTDTSLKYDVAAPITNKATITLANGKQILLDSAGIGKLATEGNVNVVKLADGQIAYNGPSSSSGLTENQYNTLTNPRGSMVMKLTLSDGSKVWLNAQSSLRYPTAFTSSQRKVEVTGEAYFEVTHDATKKFLVDANGVTTEVLGTHFNVNSYTDEAGIKITLLEGSVKVTPPSPKGDKTGVVIKPGQQVQFTLDPSTSSGQVIKVVNADVQQAVAWKNGLFSFDKADIKTVMREISRWYDLDVVYTTDVKETFYFKASRSISVSNIFKSLETTGGVHLEIDGKKIIVKP